MAGDSLPLPLHLRQRLIPCPAGSEAPYRGRFAPSPTGPLHRGNLRTALLSWLDARLHGGLWRLRIDDLDRPRNRPGAEASILADLDWLGLGWDGPLVRQSERRGLYGSVLSTLRRAGLLYPCRCSRRMLADPSAPHGEAPVYPGSCRPRSRHPTPHWGPENGRLPSWRLALPDGTIQWQERLAAPGVRLAAPEVGDPVLRRADGVLAYHLATAVDELDLGISTVVRGEDLWASTAPQVAVMEALGGTAPRYAHVPLWRSSGGERLAKRSGAEGLAALRLEGLEAPQVIGLLAASLDLLPAGAALTAEELAAELSVEALDRALRQRGIRDG
jgi:glutamyl-tRNA synthetase